MAGTDEASAEGGWRVDDDDWAVGSRPADLAGRRVLLADDDASVRAVLGYAFDDAGFAVAEAADGDQAVVELTAAAPDLMVLDLRMPGLDGFGVLRARRERGLAPSTRTIILTGEADPADVVWCWELGADEFLRKPVDPDRLLRDAVGLLRRSASEVQARRRNGLAEAARMADLEQAFGAGDVSRGAARARRPRR